jgi:hypothetical protein
MEVDGMVEDHDNMGVMQLLNSPLVGSDEDIDATGVTSGLDVTIADMDLSGMSMDELTEWENHQRNERH